MELVLFVPFVVLVVVTLVVELVPLADQVQPAVRQALSVVYWQF